MKSVLSSLLFFNSFYVLSCQLCVVIFFFFFFEDFHFIVFNFFSFSKNYLKKKKEGFGLYSTFLAKIVFGPVLFFGTKIQKYP